MSLIPRSPATPASVAVALLLLLGFGAFPAGAQRRGDCRGAIATSSDGLMAPLDEPGERMMVTGRVLDSSGTPLPGVHMLAYQTDQEGYYSRGGSNERDARLCAVVRTNEMGEYSLDTIRPGSYPTGGIPAHIHFELWSDESARQRHDLQFADDELVSERLNNSSSATSTVRPIERDSDGVWQVERDFAVR